MLGITCALYDEAVELIPLLKRQKTGSVYHYTGMIENTEVSLFLTGPGLKKNKNKLQNWLHQHQITTLLQTGYCGALNHRYQPGDVCQIGKVSSIESTEEFKMTSPDENHDLLTVGHPIFTMEERDDILLKHKADLIDMEAWHICNLLKNHFSDVKTSVIKIVGDVPGEELLMEHEVKMRAYFKEFRFLYRIQIAVKTGWPFFELYKRKRMLQKSLKSAVIKFIHNYHEHPEYHEHKRK